MSIVVFFELERGKERIRNALSSGVAIRWASNFNECLTLASETGCSGVVLGVYFSNGTVFEFVNKIKEKLPSIPVVCCCSYLATSAKWDTPIETACLALGASGYISYDKFFGDMFVKQLGLYLPEIVQPSEMVISNGTTKQYDGNRPQRKGGSRD